MWRRIVGFVGHRAREAMLWPKIFNAGPRRILFLPSDIRIASSALRGYDLAEELEARGWSTLVLPKQIELSQRKRLIRLFQPDIAVLLKSRHRANSYRLLDRIPLIYDIDDADFHNPRIKDRIREDVTHADAVIAGSRYVADWCRQFNANTTISWSGSAPIATTWPKHADRAPIVSWAQADPLGYDPERAFVMDVFRRVVARRSSVTLRLFGCRPGTQDHPDYRALRDMGVDLELRPMLPYRDFIASLTEVAVGLSAIMPENEFSRGKSFGKILAYFSAGVPVITSDEGDHSVILKGDVAVVSNDPQVWADSIVELLGDPDRRDRMAAAAHEVFLKHLSTRAAADRLERVAKSLIESA